MNTAVKIGVILHFLALPLLVFAQQATSSDVLEQALGGVVTVAIYQNDTGGSRPLGVRGGTDNPNAAYARALNLSGARASGSGFVVEQGGQKYIITNAHVVESASDAEGSISVFSINQKKYEVRVLGGDALYDFAVLAFITPPGPEVSALTLRTQTARIGERVYAIGNPVGKYPYTVTDGIVSAKNRMRGGLTGKFGFLQTTATVIWGNSGGPLVDEKGQVLGMNSQIAFGDAPNGSQIWLSQINFALETPILQRLLTDVLTNDGFVQRAYLGLEFSQLTQDNSNINDTVDPKLTAILPDSPVKTALSPFIGQRIIAINDDEVRSLEEVLGALETVRPGSATNLTFTDGIQTQVVSVTAGSLSPVQLESIARYVLTSTKFLLKDVPGGISLQLIPDDNTYELNEQRKFKKMVPAVAKKKSKSRSDTPTTTTAKVVDENLRVVAAGFHSDETSKLWRVNKLSYLGAVCRLMGLAGVVDVAFADLSDPENIRFARKRLSTPEDDLRYCLWY